MLREKVSRFCPIFFGQDEPGAFRCAAAANVILKIFQVVAVIEGQFLARGDRAQGVDENPSFVPFRLAIWRATVVDEPGWIPSDVAVQILLGINGEDVGVIRFATPLRFRLADIIADIFDDTRPGGDVLTRIAARAMDVRLPDFKELVSLLDRNRIIGVAGCS